MRETPRQEVFFDSLSQILGNGISLTANEIADLIPYSGYCCEPNGYVNRANVLLSVHSTPKSLARRGVVLALEQYRGTRIFYDGSLDIVETDIAESRATIDISIANSLEKRLETTASQRQS